MVVALDGPLDSFLVAHPEEVFARAYVISILGLCFCWYFVWFCVCSGVSRVYVFPPVICCDFDRRDGGL